jgi:hypothetical protein
VGLGTGPYSFFYFFLSPSVDSFSARFGRYCAAATVDATGTITVFFFSRARRGLSFAYWLLALTSGAWAWQQLVPSQSPAHAFEGVGAPHCAAADTAYDFVQGLHVSWLSRCKALPIHHGIFYDLYTSIQVGV